MKLRVLQSGSMRSWKVVGCFVYRDNLTEVLAKIKRGRRKGVISLDGERT